MASRTFATLVRAGLLLAALAAGGCASLPGDVQRPVSIARTDIADTQLARVAAASTPEDQRDLSGFRLLPDGEEAFQARLALIRRAEKTIDVQYYVIASDRTGLEFLGALRDAAARGVRVRILIDDLYATGQDDLFAGLAAAPNVEVRLFNPLAVRGSSFGMRIVRSLNDIARINHRMHNKLLVADHSFAITGGRNIANEYFDRGSSANFIDMDTLATGAVVGELEQAFDRFWNSDVVYPVGSLARQGSAKPGAAVMPAAGDDRVAATHSVAAELDAGRIELIHAEATVLADLPEKVRSAEGTVAAGHLALIESAQSDVLISSPYFVPSERAMAAIGELRDRDVQVSVLTNSLATTDEPVVHVGYQRHRAAILAAGAALYELMPAQSQPVAENSEHGYSGSSASSGRLHGKLAVVDGETLFVGSMNMDRRSDKSNTEYGLIIHSAALAREVAAFLGRELDEHSYRVRLDRVGGLRWIAGQGSAETSQTSEPAGRATLGMGTRLVANLIGDDML